jgi:hypothetical protein
MKITDFEVAFDINDFSDIEVDFEVDFENRYVKPPHTKEMNEFCIKYENAVKLATDIEINKNSRHYCIISGNFIFGDFIEALVFEKKYIIKEMTISTLSMSKENVDSLTGMLELAVVKKLNLIVSDYFFSNERRKLIDYIYKNLDKKNKFQLSCAGVHTKICIFETECGKKIVIHGSANLRTSGNIEQFVIEENEVLHDFNKEYHDLITEKFKTINKAVRGKELWRTINKL